MSGYTILSIGKGENWSPEVARALREIGEDLGDVAARFDENLDGTGTLSLEFDRELDLPPVPDCSPEAERLADLARRKAIMLEATIYPEDRFWHERTVFMYGEDEDVFATIDGAFTAVIASYEQMDRVHQRFEQFMAWREEMSSEARAFAREELAEFFGKGGEPNEA